MLQKTTLGALIASAIALATLPACGGEFGNCGLVMVATEPADSATIAVGDSFPVLAEVVSACPDKISHAVDFTTATPALVGLRVVSDSSAWVKGLAAGNGIVTAIGRTRTNVRASVQVRVTSP